MEGSTDSRGQRLAPFRHLSAFIMVPLGRYVYALHVRRAQYDPAHRPAAVFPRVGIQDR